MNDFKVLLEAVLDANSIKQSDISKIQKVIEKYHLNLTADLDKASIIAEIKKIVPQLEAELQKITGIDIKINDDAIIKAFNQIEKQADSLAQKVNKIQLSMGANGDTTAQIQVLRDNFSKLGLSASDVSAKMNSVESEYRELQVLMNSGGSESAIIAKFQQLQSILSQTQNNLRTTRSEYSLLATEQQRLALANTIEAWNQKNTAATQQVRNANEQYIISLRDLNQQITRLQFAKIQTGFKQAENSMRGLGKLGASVANQINQAVKSFSYWLSASYMVMELVQVIRQIPEAVKEVNSAMIELEKVSDADNNGIKNYFEEAAKSAKKLGATVSDVISATADWSRLGYSLEDSKQLAEVAVLYKNVGDGIDIDTANESLVSTLQGFQLNVSEAMGIVDKFNEVANNFPIDSAGIGEALQRSAASFYAANTDLSKSIALIAGTNAVVQDPDAVGTMWKTASMRIRGAKTELEEAGLETEGMVESTSKLRDLVKGMTGFDIMENENTFKDIYEIVIGIGKEWKNLSDIDQASLLEALAGKRQGNALSAALNNISMIEEAYKTAEASAGSALEEQETYEQGVQYSLDRLSASFQTFANHILKSEFLKGIIDFANGTVNAIDKVVNSLGTLGTIGLGAGLFAGFKNIGRPKMFGLVLKYADNYKCSLGY